MRSAAVVIVLGWSWGAWGAWASSGCGFHPSNGIDAAPGTDAATHDARDAAVAIDAPDGGGGGPIPILFVQGAAATHMGSHSDATCVFPLPNQVGDLAVVVASWSSATPQTVVVSDNKGNTYLQVGTSTSFGTLTEQVFYATNIGAGVNTVTISTGQNVPSPKVRVFEYSGVALVSPVDSFNFDIGTSSTSDSGAMVTNNDHDLLFAANTAGALSTGSGAPFTQRQLLDGDVVEDRVVTTAGTYNATAPLQGSADWIMKLVAFKGR